MYIYSTGKSEWFGENELYIQCPLYNTGMRASLTLFLTRTSLLVEMDDENEQECGVNEQDVDCLDAFNTSQVIIFIIVIKLIK